ncbi:hypothetical protein QCA50_002044 [Cerrena zonata]|uniref:Uncharacterized protein n=1 Tax=Cerrena zonata TaxID=2478898 RepID=A0AAW0GQ71_9APHY
MDYYAVSAERNSFVSDASHNQGYYQQMPQYAPAQGSYYSSDAHPPPSYFSAYPPGSFPQQPVVYDGFLQPVFQPLAYPMQYPPVEVQEIHAPIPISPYSSLIPPPASGGNHASSSRINANPDHPAQLHSQSAVNLASHVESDTSPLDHYMNAPQVTFPTPCDILNDLAAKNQDPSQRSDTPDITTPKPKARTLKASKPDSEKPTENQRKAYFRGVAENVGFKLTDPDSITSHDKKRHNLECLERYVLWLHDQIRIVNREPVPIERFAGTPNGLNSCSIRTLLLHMQIQIRKLYDEAEEERQTNTALRDIMTANRLSTDGNDYRRHSIASGAIPALAQIMHN